MFSVLRRAEGPRTPQAWDETLMVAFFISGLFFKEGGKMTEEKKLVSIPACGKTLGLSPAHIRKLVKAGTWPSYNMGNGQGGLRVDVSEIKTLTRVDKRD